jgi:hypothetical protein
LPRALVRLLAPEVEAHPVQEQGWSGRKNGALLLAASELYDVFITTDRGIPHQQNLSRYAIGIVLLEAHSNRAEDLAPLVVKLKQQLSAIGPGAVVRVSV